MKMIFLRSLMTVVKEAETAVIEDEKYLDIFDISGAIEAGEIWKKLYKRVKTNISEKHRKNIEFLLEQGSLSTRILKCAG